MILDTSAVVAILALEPEAEEFIQAISTAPRCRISAGTFVELSIVLENQLGAEAVHQCEALFRRAGVVIEPVTVEQAYLAKQAFHDFGKGRHRAGLNFGDCFSYALAKETGEELLYKGKGFRKTDLGERDLTFPTLSL
ncbi:type II toxin-antitoxin system VapC family toxin [Bryobacter aggregatus]|uniref:type II toxin-antitoxin system VapC family toxin n=1 Tax=Bryobacter aggregatus TaxID=360054 RepID=UPI00068BFCC0|nr:type II toxin-antitoxin system VapC family toxin [Bryobacter aggregatus]